MARKKDEIPYRLVYTHPDPIRVGHLKELLLAQGFTCKTTNVDLRIGMGELPPNEIWPSLYVTEKDYPAADAYLKQREADAEALADEPAWICPRCQSEVPGNFGECWSCGHVRDCPSPA